jgi:hypothetical protein
MQNCCKRFIFPLFLLFCRKSVTNIWLLSWQPFHYDNFIILLSGLLRIITSFRNSSENKTQSEQYIIKYVHRMFIIYRPGARGNIMITEGDIAESHEQLGAFDK